MKYLLVFLLLFPSIGMAAIPDCFQYRDLVNRLEREYQERPSEHGLTVNGQLMELFTTDEENESQTWTLVLVDPDGCTYPVFAGEYWTDIVQKDEEL